jgi:O-antigen ligase
MAALLAALIASLERKYVVAFACLLPLLAVAMSTRTSARLEGLLVACLALTMPIHLSLNFLFRPHLGGAPAIGIGANLLCVLALAAVWLYKYRTGEARPLFVREPSMVWASIIYMVVGILSLWNAPHPELVFLEEVRLVMLLVTMLVVMNLRREESLHTFVFFLTVVTCIQGALAAAQYLSQSPIVPPVFGAEDKLVKLDIGAAETRATGTLGHPNVLGYYLASALPLPLALLLVERRTLWRFWYLVAFVAALAGLLVTLSRGAWLSVPVSCGFTLWVLYRKKLFRLGGAVGLSLMGVVLSVFLYFALPTIEKRFSHHDYASASTRMPLNYAALSIVPQFPVLGVGLNNFAEVFRDYDTTGYSQRFTWKLTTPYSVSSKPAKIVVHNLLLWVWVEVGTVGLVAFLWIFLAAFRVAWKAYRRADDWSRAVLVACVAGMLGHLAQAQLDPGFRVSPSVSMLFYSMFGLIGAISLHQRRTVPPAERSDPIPPDTGRASAVRFGPTADMPEALAQHRGTQVRPTIPRRGPDHPA